MPEFYEKGAQKFARLPIRIDHSFRSIPKPKWLRVKALSMSENSRHLADILSEARLSTVCREASCPNIGECFSRGTAAFLVMGNVCTRRCPFCDVAHGRPDPLDATEPQRLAQAVRRMNLKYVVVTSVDRDDLSDGGALHYSRIIHALRTSVCGVRIEILIPDFRGRLENALNILRQTPPDVFNHNLETVPSLYKIARPGADYQHSLRVLREFKQLCPDVYTKSGLMLGIGETDEEVFKVLEDLLVNKVEILTLGQYLAPSHAHLPVRRYVSPDEFKRWQTCALKMGFKKVFAGVFVRSSYHAQDLMDCTQTL